MVEDTTTTTMGVTIDPGLCGDFPPPNASVDCSYFAANNLYVSCAALPCVHTSVHLVVGHFQIPMAIARSPRISSDLITLLLL